MRIFICWRSPLFCFISWEASPWHLVELLGYPSGVERRGRMYVLESSSWLVGMLFFLYFGRRGKWIRSIAEVFFRSELLMIVPRKKTFFRIHFRTLMYFFLSLDFYFFHVHQFVCVWVYEQTNNVEKTEKDVKFSFVWGFIVTSSGDFLIYCHSREK